MNVSSQLNLNDISVIFIYFFFGWGGGGDSEQNLGILSKSKILLSWLKSRLLVLLVVVLDVVTIISRDGTKQTNKKKPLFSNIMGNLLIHR